MNHPTATDHPVSDDLPAQPGRRNLLMGLGLMGGGAALGALTSAGAALAESAAPDSSPASASSPSTSSIPFHGVHQAGIVNPAPSAGALAAFDVLARDAAELRQLMQGLTQRIAFLTQGGQAPSRDAKFPPLDSGLLGPTIAPDNLTVTVAVGASLFDNRFGLASVKPKRLDRMRGFPNDALVPGLCHGDLLLQFCADSPETNIHALRDIVKHFPGQLAIRWRMDGFLPHKPPGDDGAGRNLLGFKDGTGNPDTKDKDLMDRVIWVQPDSDEPAWAAGGSYQVVRIVRHFLERWDRTPLQEQQTIFGRERTSGAPLGKAREFDDPDYAADPEGKRIPMTSHMRLANPRTPESQANLLLRRAFNYSREITKAGQLDMGLLFICFQADLEKGFITVQNRLNGEPLEEYIKPIGGGYFFALPGVPDNGVFLGQGMLEAI
ncbi:iron uptake transporter deferrochelatase/peroxidase subunit [Telmatospirillum siberiense]|uniref:Deferrochelatase n=1 Tax=Telmatospirillum siberiense TaxID=382514 RepID=A0A2N3Q135_9PROT|nr:iron uptake transporter deferrochelatase/peroxidase subunit [Telmatospirillum siberiense]PKU26357.1 deferrochelatase/peroxidase EfeB [Telmatospirillum siberiense]